MHFGVVVTDFQDWTAKAIRKGFLKCGAEATFLNFSDISAQIGESTSICGGNTDLTRLDGIVVRDLGRSGSHDVAFRYETLCHIEKFGLPIINSPQAIQNAANKFATFLALQKAKLPIPHTTVTTNLDRAKEALSKYETAVSKPLFGYKGRDLTLLHSDGQNEDGYLESTLKDRGVIYLQKFLESPTPRDIRAFVVGDLVAGAIYRIAPRGSWISNLSQGGTVQRCPLTDEIEDMALKASKAVGTTYSGVDLIETPQGLNVLEVNGTPSGKGIFQAWNVDVGTMIADCIVNKAEDR